MEYSSPEEKMAFSIAGFFNDYPLYYMILTSLAKVKAKAIPTMGVGFDSQGVPTLFYNPDFVNSLSSIDMKVILNHECQHIGLRHLQRFGAREKMLANIAMDILVNSHIPEITQITPDLYKGIMTAEKFKSLNGVDLRESTWEEVYELIKKERDKAREKFEQMMKDHGGLDSHEMWRKEPKEGEGQPQQGQGQELTAAEQAALDGLMKDAVRRLGGRDPGNVPGAIRRDVEEMLKVKYDWRQALSIFAQSVAMEDKQDTWRRPSRRFGVISPGTKKDFRPRLLVSIDNSGSISKEIYDLFTAHMIKIAEVCEEVGVIGVDTRVNFEGKVEKGKAPSYEDVSSGGGTSFQPTFDYAKKNKYDGVVYFTDGCYFDQWVTHGVPVIFALCPHAQEVQGHRNIHITED